MLLNAIFCFYGITSTCYSYSIMSKGCRECWNKIRPKQETNSKTICIIQDVKSIMIISILHFCLLISSSIIVSRDKIFLKRFELSLCHIMTAMLPILANWLFQYLRIKRILFQLRTSLYRATNCLKVNFIFNITSVVALNQTFLHIYIWVNLGK